MQAEWARQFYYFHLNAWCSQHGCVESDAFVPAVPPELLSEADRAEAESLLSQLLGTQMVKDRVEFENLVKQQLAALVEVLPSSLSKAEIDAAIAAFFLRKILCDFGKVSLRSCHVSVHTDDRSCKSYCTRPSYS